MTDTFVLVVSLILGGAVGAIIVGSIARRRLSFHDARALGAERSLEDALARSRDELDVRGLVLASMEEGILLVDPEGQRIFANDSLTRHLGTSPTSVAALHPPSLQRAVRRAGYTGAVETVDLEVDVPTRWLLANAQPAGTEGNVLLVVRDVTESRRIDAIRRDFVANASHELKTPVASIRATAETLRDGAIDDPPAARRFTEQLERDADRLARIVSDLLDLSRLETGSDRIDRVGLDRIASDVVERRRGEAAAAQVNLTIEADGVPEIAGSARDLSLLVGNLVDNAIHYTQAGGSVHVEVRSEPGIVVLRVRDTGIGIPQRDLPRVFERFYRVDQARSRETGGTGLGLAIVRHVCENHGGQVDVASELGRGSAFEVRLPTTVADDTP